MRIHQLWPQGQPLPLRLLMTVADAVESVVGGWVELEVKVQRDSLFLSCCILIDESVAVEIEEEARGAPV